MQYAHEITDLSERLTRTVYHKSDSTDRRKEEQGLKDEAMATTHTKMVLALEATNQTLKANEARLVQQVRARRIHRHFRGVHLEYSA
jgi:hypothetical protein